MWREIGVAGYRVDGGSDRGVHWWCLREEVVCGKGSTWNRVMYESEAVTVGAVTVNTGVVWKVTELGF